MKMKLKLNIRNKILLGVLPVTVLALIVTGTIAYEKSAATIKASEIHNMTQMTEALVRTLDEWYESRLNFAKSLSEESDFIAVCEGGDRATATLKLRSIHKEHGVYENVILMNPEGIILAAVGDKEIGLNVREIPSYRINIEKANQGEAHIGDVHASPVTGRPVSLITVPIVNENKIVGIVGTPIEMNSFSEYFVKPIVFGTTGNIAIIDKNGIALAHQNKDYILKVDLSKYEFGKTVLAQKSGLLEYNWNGVPKITVFREYSKLNWVVMSLVEIDDLMSEIRPIKYIVILCILISIAIIAGIVVYLIQNITTAVNDSVQLAHRISSGDFTQKLSIRSKDEVGDLIRSLNVMVDTLSPTISQIREASEQVASSSEELSASSQSLASSSSEQSANLEETSASIVQLTESIKRSSGKASEASEIAQKTGNELTHGSTAVSKTVEAMKKITDQIQIVDDIADQTNLLALNAAIEAARAGEMGKGFAVVAVEVRKLAERSQQASREIQQLAKESVAIAEEAGSIIDSAVPNSQENARITEEINAICNEQTQVAEQIGSALSALEQITQQNSATSEETASASEELSGQAQSLQALVAQFKILQQNQRTFIEGKQLPDRYSGSKNRAKLEYRKH